MNSPAALGIRPLEKSDWPVIEKLFGDKGACGGCWCMWWRLPRGGKLWEESKGAVNRANFKKLVQSGKVRAIIALADDQPVGWCSFGPSDAFPRRQRIKALVRDYPPETWSIVCFYIHPKWRGQGIASRLVQAATARAFALGASEIEGFPVVPKKAPAPIPAVFAYTGVPAIFEKEGYRELRRLNVSRPIFIKTPSGKS